MLFLLLPKSFQLVNWKQLAGQQQQRRRSPALPTTSCSSSNIMTDLTVMKQDMFGLFYKTPPAFVSPHPPLLSCQFRSTFKDLHLSFVRRCFTVIFAQGFLFWLAVAERSCKNKVRLTRSLEVDGWQLNAQAVSYLQCVCGRQQRTMLEWMVLIFSMKSVAILVITTLWVTSSRSCHILSLSCFFTG